MQTFAITVALATLASSVSAQYFGLIAARSASPIHLREINANDFGLYIGKDTSSYCPEVDAGSCPAGNVTEFAINDEAGSLSMGVVVPGGQQAYIDGCSGAISYTQAHSAAIPDGAIVEGWTLSQGDQFGSLSWTNGLYACPVENATDVYQVFAAVEDIEFSDACLGFDALATNFTEAGAWQYN